MADPKRGVAETAKVFDHGDRQAVQMPEGVRFRADEVLVRKDGEKVIIEPRLAGRRRPRTDAEWAAFWARIDALGNPDEPFPEPPPQTITPIRTWDD